MEILGKSRAEIRALCTEMGEPAYRGDQIYRALYVEKKFQLAEMTNLPTAFRHKLEQRATIALPAVKHRYHSQDGSVRYLLGLGAESSSGEGLAPGGANPDRVGSPASEPPAAAEQIEKKRLKPQRPASVEAVYMPSEGRQTICISTQAGCAVDCQFCLTAQLGLIRNLTAGEILAQVLLPLAEFAPGSGAAANVVPGAASPDRVGSPALAPSPRTDPIQTNVVLMGQGEPLLNFDNVMAALRILLDPKGVGLSPKHVTLSTSGIVPGIEKLANEPVRPKLAISLNASNDEQRDRLMPINKKYPLAKLMEACRNYPLRNWEHLTFEYVMLGGVNDSSEDARRVVRLLLPLKRVKVNLIPWNPGELPFAESEPATIERFRKVVVEKGLPAFVRYSRGRDVMAACGQLALKEVNSSPLSVLS